MNAEAPNPDDPRVNLARDRPDIESGANRRGNFGYRPGNPGRRPSPGGRLEPPTGSAMQRE
jgi:hypothetical protein